MTVNDYEQLETFSPAIKLVCECSTSAVLARVRGVNLAREDSHRVVMAYQYDSAIVADWIAEWSHPYMENLKAFSESDDREAFLEESRSERSSLGSPLGKWSVKCRRQKCGRQVQGDVDVLVKLLLQAFRDGVNRLELSSRSLNDAKSL